jgi:hypothetical protein
VDRSTFANKNVVIKSPTNNVRVIAVMLQSGGFIHWSGARRDSAMHDRDGLTVSNSPMLA